MAKILSLNAGDQVVNYKLQQQAAKLLFVVTLPAGHSTYQSAMDFMEAVNFSLDVQSETGTQEAIVPKVVDMSALAEMYSTEEDIVHIQGNTVRFSVELGADGALSFGNGTSLIINSNAIPADTKVDVYATDFPFNSAKAIRTAAIRFTEAAAQTISLANAAILHLRRGSFDQIEMLYANGKNIVLTRPEIEQWCIEGNGPCIIFNGSQVTGGYAFYSLNVADAVSAKVTLTQQDTAFLQSYIIV